MADKLVVGDKVVATFAGELAEDWLEVGDGLPATLMGVRLLETTAFDKAKNISTCKKEKFGQTARRLTCLQLTPHDV